MAASKKSSGDREAGEFMLTEVFAVVQRLNAAAGPSYGTKGYKKWEYDLQPQDSD